MMDARMETLAEAKQRLQAQLDEGLICPCCGQYARRYRRKFSSRMARSLILLYRHGYRGSLEWVYAPEVTAKYREEGKLVYWKMIEELPEPREDGGRVGWWRVTPKGEKFITRGLRIPKHAIVYNGVCRELDDSEMVTITDCLGDKFDLSELMRARS